MTDRLTPETDALHEIRHCGWRDIWSQYFEMLNLSRRFERERDEALDAAEKAKAYKRVMKDENAKLRHELDEARDDAHVLLKEIFNLTQIGDPHTAELPMKALQAIAEMIDEHLKEVRNGSER